MRSALRLARFDSGWIASPASLTSDSVSFERLGDDAVERRASELALQLEELGRRLGFGERADRVRRPARRRHGRARRRPGRSSGHLRRRCGRPRRTLRHWPWRGRPAPRRPSATCATSFLAALAGIGEQGLERGRRREGVEARRTAVGDRRSWSWSFRLRGARRSCGAAVRVVRRAVLARGVLRAWPSWRPWRRASARRLRSRRGRAWRSWRLSSATFSTVVGDRLRRPWPEPRRRLRAWILVSSAMVSIPLYCCSAQ